MGHTIGIDLGTTYSAAARVGELGKPEIILNREGENITPSVVLFQEEIPVVGTMAKRSAVTAPEDVAELVKRQMGDPDWRFVTSAGTSYRAEQISAIIVKRIKEDAELALGGEVTDAVITVPAYFDDARRRSTMDAGKIAGLNVRRVLNEPTAAALAYGLDKDVDGTILVYDLGGGTFDVTVMRISGGEFDVLGTDGDRNLGGFDWDNALMKVLNDKFQAAGGGDLFDDDAAVADLREKAENAKRTLTTVEQARVVIALGGVSKVLPVTRAEFEEATASLLSRTRDLTEMVVEEAGLTWDGIDRVLLAGGSTRMLAVRAMIEQLSGKSVELGTNPDEVVALGAAIQAQLVDAEDSGEEPLGVGPGGANKVRIRDVTSQGLGMIARKRGASEDYNAVIIPPNTKIPAKQSQTFVTIEDQQTRLEVSVTQGNDEDPDYVEKVGSQTLDIPAYAKGAPFDVAYAYDIDQTIFIEVHDKTAGKLIGTFQVHNVANMDDGEVERATAQMETLDIV